MDVVIRAGADEAEMSVLRHGPGTLVGELLADEGRPAPAIVFVDGRPVPGTCLLDRAGVGDGSVLDTRPPCHVDHADADADAAAEVVVVAGPGAGSRRRLSPGAHRLGPATDAEGPELGNGSVRRTALNLVVSPTGDVVLRAGAAVLDGHPLAVDAAWSADGIVTVDGRALGRRTVSRPHAAQSTGAGTALDAGRRTLHRPPRPSEDDEPPPLVIPEGRRRADTARRFPVLALIAPLPVAAGVAAVLGEWRFLLFGLLSPVMLFANWLEERRTRRRERAGVALADAAATAALRAAAAARFASDLARARRSQPTIVEVVDLVAVGDPRLWERRPHHDDAYRFTVAVGPRPWTPAVVTPARALASAGDVLAALGPLDSVPITVDLRAGGGIGLAGPHTATRAAARGIVLAAVALHGPADLDIVVCAAPQRLGSWEWMKWLPHTRVGGRPALLASADDVRSWGATAATAAGPTDRSGQPSPRTPITLIVADGDEWWRDRDAPLRAAFGSAAVRLVAIADDPNCLPASCTAALSLHADGRATLDHVEVLAPLVGIELAVSTARALARFDDPERPARRDDALPEQVSLLDVLGPPEPTAEAVCARWSAARAAPGLPVPIGVGERGPVVVDLVADGPHGLIAGTTGAGKSELLRTIVLGLAATVAPAELNVALVDFKGGAAFDACAELPHAVALVTDLDEHLAGRVLRSLQAELTHREQVLRAAGAGTIDEYRRISDAPLPRLLLVVDEFALLAAELPAFVPALVDIAQRGRSLGFHLLLATQRPAGVVDAKIRANTNLRVALRVQDDTDSMDVIGSRVAATLPRRIPGRAVARLGAGELVLLQTAWSSGTRRRVLDGDDLETRPFVAGRDATPLERRWSRTPRLDHCAQVATTDIERIVAAVTTAAVTTGQERQRQPYLDPLPTSLPIERLLTGDGGGDGVPFALADLPDQQRQEVRRWHPGTSLVIHGIAGAGTSSALATLAIGLASQRRADDVHLYVIDADANLLAPLDDLPHTGAVVGLDDPGRIDRLLRHLVGELSRRRRLAAKLGSPAKVVATEPTIVVFVDNIGALRQAIETDRTLVDAWPAFELIVRDGRPLGVGVVLTSPHERALPAALAAAIPDRLVMRAADRHAYAAFGLRPGDVPTMVAGRALDPEGPTELQIASPPADLARAVATVAAAPSNAHGPTERRPVARIEALPERLALRPLLHGAADDGAALRLPIGIDLRNGQPLALRLHPRTTTAVLGPAGSGRTTLLRTLALGVQAAGRDVTVFAVGPQPHPFVTDAAIRRPAHPSLVSEWVDELLAAAGRRLVLIDDADELGGPSFERLATARTGDVMFVLAGTPDGLRGVAHWARPLLRTRTGVLLRPSPADGDLLRAPLPAHLPPSVVGHGLLVDHDHVVPVLIAEPEDP